MKANFDFDPVDPSAFADAIGRYLAATAEELTEAMRAKGYDNPGVDIDFRGQRVTLWLWADRKAGTSYRPRVFGHLGGSGYAFISGESLAAALGTARKLIADMRDDPAREMAPWFELDQQGPAEERAA